MAQLGQGGRGVQGGWTQAGAAAEASVESRAGFIVKTYLHLFGAIGLFVALLAVWFVTPVAELMLNTLFSVGRFGWIAVIAGFVGISWLANSWARSATSKPVQYAGLGLYAFAESLIFVPLIALALSVTANGDPLILPRAAITTLVLFGGLTGVVFLTRKDFSFLRGILMFGGFAALGLALLSVFAGFSLGMVFWWAMVVLAGGYILYDTSNVMLHYRTDQYVAASLALFASVALLFWYVLRIFLASSRR